MPYEWTAQNIVSINPINFKVEGGNVVGLEVSCEVNYGEFGMSHQIDVWQYLNPGQKQVAQNVYNFLKSGLEQLILP